MAKQADDALDLVDDRALDASGRLVVAAKRGAAVMARDEALRRVVYPLTMFLKTSGAKRRSYDDPRLSNLDAPHLGDPPRYGNANKKSH